MRLRLGRPDIDRYRNRFDLVEAGESSPVTVTFLGVSTLLIDDGSAALVTDGFFTRPSLARVLAGRLSPDPARVRAGLQRAGVDELAGAGLYGGTSVARVGEGHGLNDHRVHVVADGGTVPVGGFEVGFVASEHCPPDRRPGEIPAPVIPPARVSAYRCGESWSLLVHHPGSGRRLLIQGSAGFVPGALAGRPRSPTWGWASSG